MKTQIEVEENEKLLINLSVDVLPRPGEQLRLIYSESNARQLRDHPPGKPIIKEGTFEVVRISFVGVIAGLGDEKNGPTGWTRTIVHVRALETVADPE